MKKATEGQSKGTLLWQFIKFNIVGLLNTLIDNGLYVLLCNGLGVVYWLAKIVSYSAGVLNSWLWNSRWTFASKKEGAKAPTDTRQGTKRFMTFIGVNLVSLGVSLFVLWVCKVVGKTEPSWWMNLFLATPASLLVNFAGNKFLVFRDSDEKISSGNRQK